jgi:hypothetical protein
MRKRERILCIWATRADGFSLAKPTGRHAHGLAAHIWKRGAGEPWWGARPIPGKPAARWVGKQALEHAREVGRQYGVSGRGGAQRRALSTMADLGGGGTPALGQTSRRERRQSGRWCAPRRCEARGGGDGGGSWLEAAVGIEVPATALRRCGHGVGGAAGGVSEHQGARAELVAVEATPDSVGGALPSVRRPWGEERRTTLRVLDSRLSNGALETWRRRRGAHSPTGGGQRGTARRSRAARAAEQGACSAAATSSTPALGLGLSKCAGLELLEWAGPKSKIQLLFHLFN